jgi:hypothetical protein
VNKAATTVRSARICPARRTSTRRSR